MRWSYELGTFAGIPVYIHATFLLLIAWVITAQGFRGALFVLALFACVVLHEFGHALTARRYGIRTRDITLLPIGGLARLERMPTKPLQELWVALAGPAVNVVLAACFFSMLWAAGSLESFAGMSVTEGPFLERLALVNLWLAAFNLLPAFPMDGGRVFRALLATRLSYARATQLAATLGQGMALLFGFVGLFANPMLLFIAFFVWIGASQEAGMVEVRSALGGIPVRSAMVTDFRTLVAGDSLDRAVLLVLAGAQQDFPVVEGAEVVGVLTRRDLIAALARTGPRASVGSVMRREFPVADVGEMLEEALPRLRESDVRIVPVLEGRRLVGLITDENVGEFLAIRSAMRRPLSRASA